MPCCLHRANATEYDCRFRLLADALKFRPDAGLVLEFGVWMGESINFLASAMNDATVYGFDSFAGLPERWRPGFEKGMFATAIPKTRPNAELIIGSFDDSLPEFLKKVKGNISFVHVDCDLYISAKTVLSLCESRIVPGTVIVFDEYFNYPSWEQHEYKAFQEFVGESGRSFKYLSFVPQGQQVCVVMGR